MKSKVTGGSTKLLFQAKILNKYNVSFYQCDETGFIQTEEPYWLQEAYSSAITKLDIGLVHRNQELSAAVSGVIRRCFPSPARFLDYAGGYGMMTRMMRDKGYDFYHTDKFCANLFAEYFDLKDLDTQDSFQLVTAFEVFEHLTDPVAELKGLLQLSDTVLFSTELVPEQTLSSVDDWWYFIPETGQHISFFTEKALRRMASDLELNFYTNHRNLHMFTRHRFPTDPMVPERDPFFIRKMKKIVKGWDARHNSSPESLLEKDWQYIKHRLPGNQ